MIYEQIIKWDCIVSLCGLIRVQNCISWGLMLMWNCSGYLTVLIIKKIQLLSEFLESSQRESSMSQLWSIHHCFHVTQHTRTERRQWPVSDHNGDNYSRGSLWQDMRLGGLNDSIVYVMITWCTWTLIWKRTVKHNHSHSHYSCRIRKRVFRTYGVEL